MRNMHHILTILLCTFFVTHAEFTASQIAQKYSQSVVTIIALDENDQPLSLGSGFFLNEKGDVATNHHVLEGCYKAIIKTTTGEKGSLIEIIRDDSYLDLIVAESTFKNTIPLPLGDSDIILVGPDMVAIGNPAGVEGTESKGIKSGIRKVDDFTLIQITAPISPGSSGGPVFDLSGEVIGIATSYLEYGQSLNFAMPVNYLKELKKCKLNLSNLQKDTTVKSFEKDKSLIKIFDIHYYYPRYDENLTSVNFAIMNQSNYLIKNVHLFFIYRNYRGEIITYSDEIFNESILPHLALQFKHIHWADYFRKKKDDSWNSEWIEGEIEIRILDFEIDRNIK